MAKPRGVILQIRIVSSKGSRQVVIPQSFTFFNMHRLIQFTLSPKMTETAIDKKVYEFVQGDTKAKKTKQTKMATFSLEEGNEFKYTCESSEFTCTIERCVADAEINRFVPRCISAEGNPNIGNVNHVNKVLLFKRFGVNNTMNKRPKEAPKILCRQGANVWKIYYTRMRQPARSHQEVVDMIMNAEQNAETNHFRTNSLDTSNTSNAPQPPSPDQPTVSCQKAQTMDSVRSLTPDSVADRENRAPSVEAFDRGESTFKAVEPFVVTLGGPEEQVA
ncbi:hypothetical protein HDU85_006742 [Gaertneriomyces sp. JEL0708]|nr:hypothetical protein HDU85_006742 [Gaertneriomyces sp. JEL0708]